MRGLGVTTQDDFVYELRNRYGFKTRQSAVSNWTNGKHEPEFEATVVLLHAAGWLNTSQQPKRRGGPIEVAEEAVRRLDAGEPIPPGRLEELAGEVAETAVRVTRLAARLSQAARDARSGS